MSEDNKIRRHRKRTWLERDRLGEWIDDLCQRIPKNQHQKIENWEKEMRKEIGGAELYIQKGKRNLAKEVALQLQLRIPISEISHRLQVHQSTVYKYLK